MSGIARSRVLAGLAGSCAALGVAPLMAAGAARVGSRGPTVGQMAPEFTDPGVRRGVDNTFDLRKAVRSDGTVMLYFFVKAFTPA